MRTPLDLFPYQQRAVNHQCSMPYSMLFLDMGLGKSICTLTSIVHLLNNGFLSGVLIVAPIRVCRLVWRQEALKWSHTQHLTFSMVMGTKDQRTRALLRPANCYIINHENLEWLAEVLHTYFIKKNKTLPFNGVVWDESSRMKNSTTNRVKAVRKILDHFIWATGLTGTPASNGFKDLHGQYLVVDKGQRLGTSKTAFRTRFYKKEGPYKEVPYADTETIITELIGDITLSMSAADYNPLPDLIVNNIEVELPADLRCRYDLMEQEMFITLDSGAEKEMFNAAALTNACLQFSNGAMYPVSGMPLWEPVHDLKLDALEDIIEEANGQQILCSYAYRSDAERIMTRFKALRPINLTECKTQHSLDAAMKRWKDGDCQLMIGHPACLGADTQVLTERNGWVRITDVTSDDRVFDGVEFVTHSGCSYSGHKDVIDVFGIIMTPDHRLLIGNDWMEACDVRDSQITSRQAHWGESKVHSFGEVSEVWRTIHTDEAERRQAQHREANPLRSMRGGSVSLSDGNAHLANLARNENEVSEPDSRARRTELRWSWNHCVRAVAILRQLLRGYARRLLGRPDNRTHQREQVVLQIELPMGNQHGAAEQQAKQSLSHVSRREVTSCRSVPTIRCEQDENADAAQQGDERRHSSSGRSGVTLRQESASDGYQASRRAHVYDLVDCGPRHRFLIRNDAGEMFISHNSMGHGVDGLQAAGHTIVWFGLNWSLDLYEQMNARLRRQGQGAPVICHRILCKDTLDQAQALALDEKAQTQSALRNAVKQYRALRGA